MIVIPMAGMSSRFQKAGYKLPKYMLQIGSKTVFQIAVESFKRYFSTEEFCFICRDIEASKQFVTDEAKKMGIQHFHVVVLQENTKGQAETVALGLKQVPIDDNTQLTIFNIDTFRPNFCFPGNFDLSAVDGYLETFVGEGENWSFVKPRYSDVVEETAEKRAISEYCCTGLYCFSHASDFFDVFDSCIEKGVENLDAGEYYVAPMYNQLITQGKDIRFTVISRDEVVFCGVPAEYENLVKNQDGILKRSVE